MKSEIISRARSNDVVHFVYLHLDSARKSDEKASKEDHYAFMIEGKARPMIVLSYEPRKLYGSVNWYQVIRLTTTEKKGWTKRIGSILKSGEVSFGYAPEWYPSSLMCSEYPPEHLDRITAAHVRMIFRKDGFAAEKISSSHSAPSS